MKKIKRHKDWRKRLDAYLREMRECPFEWGKNDCATFTAGAVKVITGRDLMYGFRGYKTYEQGMEKLRKKGFDHHVDVIASILTEIPPQMARDGDVAVVKINNEEATGVVVGTRFVQVPALPRLGLVPLSKAIRSFKVGQSNT